MCNKKLKKTKSMIVDCIFCFKPFKRIASVNTEFCSRQCFLNSTRIEFNCKFCKKTTILPKWKASNKQFCSTKCNGEFIKQNKRKQLICKTCKSSFTVMGYMKNKSKYCSIQCFSNRTNKIVKPTIKKIIINCKTCDKTYQVWNYRKKSAFCSRECKHNDGRFFGICRRCDTKFFEEKNVVNSNLIRKYYCLDCIKYIPSCHNSGFQLDVYDYFLKTFKDVNIDYNIHIKFEKRIFWPDLILNKKIIIECQGDYYHCNPSFYDNNYFNLKRSMYAYEIWKKDEERKKFLNDNGYVVYYIWENDWKKDKDLVIEKIKGNIYGI